MTHQLRLFSATRSRRCGLLAAAALASAGALSSVTQPAAAADPVTVSVSDVTVTEGTRGTTEAVFIVTLSEPSTSSVRVDFASESTGTATDRARGRDFVRRHNTLDFAPGRLQKRVRIPINPDGLDENNETFTLNLTSATNATIADGTGLGTIADDDTAVLSISDATIAEPTGPGSSIAVLNLNLSTPIDRTVVVSFATADETATAKDDYGPYSGNRTFRFSPAAGGQTRKVIKIHIKPDTLVEGSETFNVNLTVGSDRPAAPDLQGTVTITDS